uniref:ATP synthase subunit a n=1 Tax=Onchidella borealis TaxID=244421 RepID=E6Y1C7_9EUPU|nr:ATP synthase F0 subunit 6 [Onchidella borealis]
MMSDLFSSLDGCNSYFTWGLPLALTGLFLINYSWPCQLSTFALFVGTSLSDKSKRLAPLSLMSFVLIVLIISLNLIGLFPLAFGVTSSLWMASTLGLLLWGLLVISGWISNPMKSAANLAPAGAPAALIWFLVLVETVSLLIRPLTLTVRLIANISAGHVVLSLVANCMTSVAFSSSLGILLVSVGYNLFEIFVCFIQAYIFTLLVSLYSQEHP